MGGSDIAILGLICTAFDFTHPVHIVLPLWSTRRFFHNHMFEPSAEKKYGYARKPYTRWRRNKLDRTNPGLE